MRAIIAIIALLALGGCAGEAPVEQPTMYADMANGGRLDPIAAASMISLYRQNNGLGAVTVDPELMKLAEAQSQAMASRNKLAHLIVDLLHTAGGAGVLGPPRELGLGSRHGGGKRLHLLFGGGDLVGPGREVGDGPVLPRRLDPRAG